MYRLDSADHFLSIQCDLFCHLQRKRYPPHYPGRASAQNPLSFFGKKDLADLTSTIMADCTFLEQSFSHFIPELAGSIISTVLISIGLLFTDWRMALAALWVLPVAFAIVGFSAKIQENLNQKSMDVKMACADGIQECIETVRDLKANNAEQAYLKGLEKKEIPCRWSIVPSSMNSACCCFCGFRIAGAEAWYCNGCAGGSCFAHARKPLRAYILYVPSGSIPFI